MKLLPKNIESFLKHIPEDVRAILVYGPDHGLVSERAQILAKQVVADINDPFNTAHLTGAVLADDPARLMDEANAQSLMGGKRLIRISDAGNAVSESLKSWLKSNPNRDAVIILSAGDLKPKDSLRKICEDLPNAAAVPCYVEDERDLARFMQQFFRDSGFAIQPDAMQALISGVKGDRARARSEAEKLILYMGDGRSINLNDVQQSVGDQGTQSLDELVSHSFNRNIVGAITAFRRLSGEGVELIIMLRSLQNHLYRLHLVRVMMDTQGLSLEQSMAQLHPPVFFKQVDAFKAQVMRYSAPQLRKLLSDLAHLESKTKQTGTPSETLFEHFITHLAA